MRARGAALLLVLWLVALLTTLVGSFALAARTEHLQAQALARGVAAESAARAGVEYAVWRMTRTDRSERWVADGRPYVWHPPGGAVAAEVTLRITDESGKVDLNWSDSQLLSALLKVLGSDGNEAGRLAAAIIDWRDADSLAQPGGAAEDRDYAAAGRDYGAADAPFASISELEQVLGMTPAVYARLAPHVTVYSGRAVPDPTFASGPVLDAQGYGTRPDPSVLEQLSLGGNGGLYGIESRAHVSGRTSMLRVVVRLGGNGRPGSAWAPVRWDAGALQQ